MKFLLFSTVAFVLVRPLSATEPAAEITQPASEKTEEAARKVVERYYAELDGGHYEVAYRLWRNDGSSTGKILQVLSLLCSSATSLLTPRQSHLQQLSSTLSIFRDAPLLGND